MDIGLKILISSIVTLLILSFLIFLVYKVLQVRTRRDVRKAYYNAMSRFWFGIFMVIFGLIQASNETTFRVGPQPPEPRPHVAQINPFQLLVLSLGTLICLLTFFFPCFRLETSQASSL